MEKIYTLDELCQHLVSSFQAQNDHHFYDGDLINAFCQATDMKQVPLGKIAEHLQCSKAYVGNLWKCSKFYPQEVREAFSDQKWTWFVELLTMPEAKSMSAMDVCTKYADYSLRELKDLKAQLSGNRDGKVKITITLMSDKYKELIEVGSTNVSFVLEDKKGIASLKIEDV